MLRFAQRLLGDMQHVLATSTSSPWGAALLIASRLRPTLGSFHLEHGEHRCVSWKQVRYKSIQGARRTAASKATLPHDINVGARNNEPSVSSNARIVKEPPKTMPMQRKPATTKPRIATEGSRNLGNQKTARKSGTLNDAELRAVQSPREISLRSRGQFSGQLQSSSMLKMEATPPTESHGAATYQYLRLSDLIHPGDSQLLGLPWGGQLSYAQLGRRRAAGPTWVIFHGTPGCRLVMSSLHDYAEGHRIRLIAIDRPGYGHSTLDENRRMMDHVKDVEYLLNYLDIGQFKILGTSGGGPYALAAAYHFPRSRLLKTSIMCGATHPDFVAPSRRIEWKIRDLLDEWKVPFCKRTFPFDGELVRIVRELKGNEKGIRLARFRSQEMRRQGTAGYRQDFRLMRQPWDFPLTEIDAGPIRWYHGTLDENTSSDAARETAKHVSVKSKIDFIGIPGLDHFEIQSRKFLENMQWLAK